ncbi:MAG: hypothetical protein PHN74_02510 [Candidatus Pacebacteria bacterium]|nr:hypothetical protein [Candidatus Paceibacterota bacterium]
MEQFEKASKDYFKTLAERGKKSKVFQSHQSAGLMLAEILEDFKHKALYMKLAKTYGGDSLLNLAKKIAERKDVFNKGAYFMKILKISKDESSNSYRK